MRSPLNWLTAILLGLMAAVQSMAASWSQQYDVIIEGARRGYASTSLDMSRGEFRQRLVLDIVQLRKRIRITRETVIRRGEEGQLVALRVLERGGRQRQLWTGTVRRGVLRLRSSDHQAKARELRWDDALLLADTELLAVQKLGQSGLPGRDGRVFDPWLGAWRRWQAQRLQTTATGTLFKIIEGNRLPDEWVRIELDADGRLRRQWVQRAGLLQEWLPCTADCTRAIEQPLDILDTQAVRSPFHIPQIALAGPIRYVLARRDGQPPQLEVTAEQQVIADGSKQVLTICSDCGTPESTLSAADRRRYLAANAWVRSDDARIRKFARLAGNSRSPPDRRMRKLELLVSEHMQTIDMLGYKDAVEALQSRSGDCTESAILLAAAARAQGIPTRIVAGLVYSDRFSGRRDVFAPHYWVQAWIGGRWTSYDAGVLGFDATHIALGAGDGDPAQTAARTQQLGQLVIEQMGQLPQRPAPQAAQTSALPVQ